MIPGNLIVPVRDWPDGIEALSSEDAAMRIINGDHREARERGQCERKDAVLLRLMQRGEVAFALGPDDTMYMRPTMLAVAKYLN